MLLHREQTSPTCQVLGQMTLNFIQPAEANFCQSSWCSFPAIPHLGKSYPNLNMKKDFMKEQFSGRQEHSLPPKYSMELFQKVTQLTERINQIQTSHKVNIDKINQYSMSSIDEYFSKKEQSFKDFIRNFEQKVKDQKQQIQWNLQKLESEITQKFQIQQKKVEDILKVFSKVQDRKMQQKVFNQIDETLSLKIQPQIFERKKIENLVLQTKEKVLQQIESKLKKLEYQNLKEIVNLREQMNEKIESKEQNILSKMGTISDYTSKREDQLEVIKNKIKKFEEEKYRVESADKLNSSNPFEKKQIIEIYGKNQKTIYIPKINSNYFKAQSKSKEVTRTYQKDGVSKQIILPIILRRDCLHRFHITINYSKSRNIAIGITDKKSMQQQTSNNDCVFYVGNGGKIVYGENGTQFDRAEGVGFGAGQVVTMETDLEMGRVRWLVKHQQRASITLELLKETRQFVPFIAMCTGGDIIEWEIQK